MLIIIERSTQIYLPVGWYASIPANCRQFHCTRKMTILGVSFLDSCCPRSNTGEDAILNQQVPVMQSKKSRADSSGWRRHGWSANKRSWSHHGPSLSWLPALHCIWLPVALGTSCTLTAKRTDFLRMQMGLESVQLGWNLGSTTCHSVTCQHPKSLLSLGFLICIFET